MNGCLKGLVFDVRRFSTHDGAGIRTTAFLKGCPLRCIWCQNPEGIAPKPRLMHFQERCIGCGRCLEIKDGAMRRDEKGVMYLEAAQVAHPSLYEAICPAAALRMDSRWYELEALVKELLRDQAFFRHGGGVTLSGGEPFFQKKFTLALLQRLKEAGVHTAVESSLCADWTDIEAALPWTDTLFADFKVADSQLHRAVTGVENEKICANLRQILQSTKRDHVIVRTPLIPEFTATKENIAAIAEKLTSWYPKVRYELLNYNPLAKAKYKHVEQKYCFEENPPLYTKQELDAFYRAACQAGIQNLIVESE